MVEDENKVIFHRFYEDTWNTGDLALVDDLLAADFVNYEITDTAALHRELYKRAIVDTRTAFPDWMVIIEDLIAEGEKVAARWRLYGTHIGASVGLPPTGNRMGSKGSPSCAW